MTEKDTQLEDGLASDLNRELGLADVIKLFLMPRLWQTRKTIYGDEAFLKSKEIYFSKTHLAVKIRHSQNQIIAYDPSCLAWFCLMPFTFYLLLMMKVNRT